jgi:hypothetical protein
MTAARGQGNRFVFFVDGAFRVRFGPAWFDRQCRVPGSFSPLSLSRKIAKLPFQNWAQVQLERLP